MPPRIFGCELVYLLALLGLFIAYAMSPTMRKALPSELGPLPVGVVWFGATGAVISAFGGIFYSNQKWKSSYNYWYYIRPLFGAVTGAVGALLYWVTLRLGDTSPVTVNQPTFYAVSFVLGFADRAFVELLQNVTQMIIRPGQRSAPGPAPGPPGAPSAPGDAGSS